MPRIRYQCSVFANFKSVRQHERRDPYGTKTTNEENTEFYNDKEKEKENIFNIVRSHHCVM